MGDSLQSDGPVSHLSKPAVPPKKKQDALVNPDSQSDTDEAHMLKNKHADLEAPAKPAKRRSLVSTGADNGLSRKSSQHSRSVSVSGAEDDSLSVGSPPTDPLVRKSMRRWQSGGKPLPLIPNEAATIAEPTEIGSNLDEGDVNIGAGCESGTEDCPTVDVDRSDAGRKTVEVSTREKGSEWVANASGDLGKDEEGTPAEKERTGGAENGDAKPMVDEESAGCSDPGEVISIAFNKAEESKDDDDLPPIVFPERLSTDIVQVIQAKNTVLVRAGTLEGLVMLATHPDLDAPEYVAHFLATFPLFVGVEDLIRMLSFRAEKSPESRGKILALLNSYALNYSEEWRAFPKLVSSSRKLLNKESLWTGLEKERDKSLKAIELLTTLGGLAPPLVMLPKKLGEPVSEIKPPKELDARTFAHTVVAMNRDRFLQIQARELLGNVWMKKEKEEKAPTVLEFVQFSTRISDLVANLITLEPKPRKRAGLLQLFIAAADECRAQDDFSGVMAIVLALGMSPVHRMKASWSLLSDDAKKLYEDLLKLTDRGESNYRNLRRAHATTECIPHLGMFLSDLVFVEEGNPTMLSSVSVSLKLQVGLVVGSADVPEGKARPKVKNHRFHSRESTQELLKTMVELNGGDVDLKKYMLFVPAMEQGNPGQWLNASPDMRICDCSLYGGETVMLRCKLQPLKYSVGGGSSNTATLDVSQPVGDIVAFLLRRFAIRTPEYVAPYVDVPLDRRKSLSEQGVFENEELQLRMALPLSEIRAVDNDRFLDLAFTDTVKSVERQPIARETSIALMALHMRAVHGSVLSVSGGRAEVTGESGEVVEIPVSDHFLPEFRDAAQTSAKEGRQASAEVMARLLELGPMSAQEAKCAYIELAKSLSTAEGKFYRAKMQVKSNSRKGGFVDQRVFVGATPSMFMLVHGTTKEILNEWDLDGIETVRNGTLLRITIPERTEILSLTFEQPSHAQSLVYTIARRADKAAETTLEAEASGKFEVPEGGTEEVMMINFAKLSRTGAIIRNTQELQKRVSLRPKRAAAHPVVRTFIEGFSGFDEDTLFDKSLEIEPRGFQLDPRDVGVENAVQAFKKLTFGRFRRDAAS